MGLAPASVHLVRLVLVVLLTFAAYGRSRDSAQVGTPSAGVDVRIPLDAFQCDPWLIYYKIQPNDYGRSLGFDYNDLALHLTTPDDARRLIVRINIPSSGEGVIQFAMNMRGNAQFYVNPHGPVMRGDYVQVKTGGGGSQCLDFVTRTMNDRFATFDAAVHRSIQTQNFGDPPRFQPQRTTSPEAGLQTFYVPAGVLVTPARTSTPAPSPPSLPSPSPTGNQDPQSSDNAASRSLSSTSSGPIETDQETASSQSSSNSSLPDNNPESSRSGDSPAPTGKAGQGTEPDQMDKGDGDGGSTNSGNQPNDNGSNSGPDGPGGQSRNILPAIIGAVVGGILLLIGLLCAVILRARRRKRAVSDVRPFVMLETGSSPATASASTRAILGNSGNIVPRRTTAAVTNEKRAAHPQRRISFQSESTPETSYVRRSEDTSTSPDFASVPSTSAHPMDLAQALAVVAAHVQAGAPDVGLSPPAYSHSHSSASEEDPSLEGGSSTNLSSQPLRYSGKGR